MQDAPAGVHIDDVQVPPVQVVPVEAPQQSLVVTHDWPALRHAHTPPVHTMASQHSSPLAHVAPAALHAQWPLAHAPGSPPQQSPSPEQLPPTGLQQVPDVPDAPAWQVSNPQHAADEPLAVQVIPEVPHGAPGAVQWPPLQVAGAVQSDEPVHTPPTPTVPQCPP